MTNIKEIICLCGNDGTGKSTLIKLISKLYPQYHVIERSTPQQVQQFQKIRKQIKYIDFLTYRYSFQQERNNFQPSHNIIYKGQSIPINWVMLDLDPKIIAKRIKDRQEMGIYQSKKCVQYFSYVYLQLAIFYGMTIVDVSKSPQQIVDKIINLIQTKAFFQIRGLSLKHLNYQQIQHSDVQHQIQSQLSKQKIKQIISLHFRSLLQKDDIKKQIYIPQILTQLQHEGELDQKLSKVIAARWVLQNCKIDNHEGKLSINIDLNYQIKIRSPSFVNFIEGQSKKIYKIISQNQVVQNYYKQKIIILLKSTIYSHTNQHTGQIQHLSQIRAFGSNLFMQMLRRNNLHHAYLGINKLGIIISRLVQINNLQIVFKKQLIGTDKHSYFGMSNIAQCVNKTLKYSNGIYVRFDWRNPNHQIKKYPNYQINSCPYYYIIQKTVGKQTFFKKFLKKQGIRPMGDKCISQDVIQNYVDTKKIKKSVLSLYCAFTYYCEKIGLQIIDGCCMFNNDGSMAWSQINPDCMRVKTIQGRKDYDKDIWRTGGSSSKEAIKQKWSTFNKMIAEYFVKHRFHQTQLLQTTPLSYPMNKQARRLLENKQINLSQQYKYMLKQIAQSTQLVKDLIGTIDISDSKPTLVKSSQLTQNHSQNSLQCAYNYINLLPKILLVDLDAACNKQTNNRKSIKNLLQKANNNIFGVGGGIRSLQILKHCLQQLGLQKIVLSSNLQLLDNLSPQQIQKHIIIQLSINQNNQILTHGRTINTKQNVIKKIIQLTKKGVNTVSLTFNQKEGHLQGIPRNQFRDIMFSMPGKIKKVIIAGGISSLDDLQYIWGFQKTVPQLGSAIWKKKIEISQIVNQLARFNKDQLLPALIVDETGVLLGQIFMNEQSLKLSCQTRQLYRYSRQLKRLIKKGQQSGKTQKIIGMKFDCDRDCIKIIVEESLNTFCHQNSKSCFDNQNVRKIQNIPSLQKHLLRKKQTGSGYSKEMQENQNLALSKMIQQVQELSFTSDRHLQESSDLIAHFLMYLNSKNIPIQKIINELERRSRIKKQSISNQKNTQNIIIGVMGGKHFQKIDKIFQQLMGAKLQRSNERSLKINIDLVQKQQYSKYFGQKQIDPIGIKSKDMAVLLGFKKIKWCFNYSIMMENYPKIWKQIVSKPVQGIKLVLLKRKNSKIDPFSWNSKNKGVIISQYPLTLSKYFNNIGVAQTNYKLIKVCGGTEGYLHNTLFDYCDAIVESGATLQANNLQIEAILCSQIRGGLYTLI